MPSKECRICLRHEENCISLFAKRRGTKLAEIVRFCARVEISEEDGLPGDACERCVDEALNAYLFVNKCRRSDAELRTAQACCKEGLEDEEQEDGHSYAQEGDTDPGSEVLHLNSVVEFDKEVLHKSPNAVLNYMDTQESIVTQDVVEDVSVQNEFVHYETPQSDESIKHIEMQLQVQVTDDMEDTKLDEQVVKQETSQEEYEGEDFLIEYLEDDSKTNSPPPEVITDDPFVEFENDEISTALEGLEQANANVHSSKNFVCCGIRCRAICSTQEELNEHSIQVHSVDRESECTDKTFECNQCYARFSTEKSLSLHSRKPSNCPFCLEEFISLKEKRLHMQQVHGQAATVCLNNASKKICCGCHQSFDTEEDLRTHSEDQHSIRKSAVDETRPHQCDICYKRFRTFESLRIHQRFVYRPKNFVCLTCNRAFDTRSKLAAHELVHSNQRNFQCDTCDKSFKKEIDLKSHVLLHNEKQEVCPVCGLRFHRKSNLRMHMRKHQDTFFYACPDCPKQFKNNSHLKEHYKVHSKLKPYSCSFCERCFAYYSDRKRHEMTHTGNYPFECSCAKKFARKTTFEKHVSICQDSTAEQYKE